jgi:hypothetical protein
MLGIDAALAAAQPSGRPAALEFSQHVLHLEQPPGVRFRPNQQ